MILLKSSVVVGFLLLIVLSATFVIVKKNKTSNSATTTGCDKNKKIAIAHDIENIKVESGVITVVTKVFDGKQEVIRFSASCGEEINKVVFVVEAKTADVKLKK